MIPGNWVTPWRRSILWGAVLSVVTITAVVGLLFIIATSEITSSRAHQQVNTRLSELLDTVESTASIACFVKDQALAAELTRGLLKNSEVAGATIIADNQELASMRRTPSAGAAGEANALAPTLQTTPLARAIRSPFDPTQIVGHISLEPNTEVIDALMKNEVSFVGSMLALLLLAIGLSIMVGLLWLVIKPIKAISDGLHGLHGLEGGSGNGALTVPWGHEETEIGRLVGDINGMSARLFNALKEERQLREIREADERKFRAIFTNAGTGIFIIDWSAKVQSANPAFSRLLSAASLPIGALTPLTLLDFPWRDPAHVGKLLDDLRATSTEQSADLELDLPSGETRWLSAVLSPIGPDIIQGLINDVTERRKTEDSARLLAITDPLTGTPNRAGLERLLQQLMAHQNEIASADFALMLFDIDGFKRINDALGFPAGDHLLKTTAQRMRVNASPTAHIAHVGGGLFALLQHASDSDAGELAHRTLQALTQAVEIESSLVQLTVSVGIALFPEDGTEPHALMRNAELALARAKVGGGNGIHFFDHSMVEQAEYRQRLETDMQYALRRQEFHLVYQPIIDLDENCLTGAEALIRWQHPVRGLVPPDAFIPLAEESGLIGDIGAWALEAACRQLDEWRLLGLDLTVALNVSARQIPDALPLSKLRDAVVARGINPSRLILEITEGALLDDVAGAQAWLGAVREYGFRVSLDDFGTGYSSLSYLKRFPVDSVKIDKSFVRDMDEDMGDRALVEAIVAMARSLRLRVVAEGVEKAAQLELLRKMGCRYAQGYFFARPLLPDDFVALIPAINADLAQNASPPRR